MSEAALVIPHWNKDHLTRGHTLYGFTQSFFQNNRKRRLPPTRTEVNVYWALKVMEAFPDSDNRARINLLEQNTCPLIESFWQQRAGEKVQVQTYQETAKSKLYISDREQSKHEKQRHPYAVIMCHPVLGEIFVPSIQIIPLHQLSYLKIVRKIIEANPTKEFSHFVLQELWEAILTNVYAYEYTWREKKRTEYSESDDQLIQNMIESKGRKRSVVEEHLDDSDAPSANTKRVKISALQTPSNSDVTPSSASEQKTQTTRQIPTPPQPNTPSLSRPNPTRAQSSSRPQADDTHPVAPVHPSDSYKLSDKEAEMVGRGVAPWPYDPRTGKKTDYVGEYAISTRELHMDMVGIPPWTYDPRTGVKTKISAGYGRRHVSQYGMTGVRR